MMALNNFRLWLLKPVRHCTLTTSFTDSIQRFPWAACSFSSRLKDKKSSSSENVSQVHGKAGTKRQKGVRPEHNPAMIQPHHLKYKRLKLKFVLQGVDLTKYTHSPIPYPKTGGRGWDGRVFNKRIGGGARQMYRMLDYTRPAISTNEPLVEKVINVRYDPLRSADIALVASGNHKRWIIAEENMKAGDLIKSHSEIPKLPVFAKAGDAHPLGALPVGSVVHNIEMFENEGGHFARAAGTSGMILRKRKEVVTVRLPSGREANLSENCMATVGRVSNIYYGKTPVGSAQRNRWFGVRPSSGLFQKKNGYHGRKIKPPKPAVTYQKKTKKALHEMFDT